MQYFFTSLDISVRQLANGAMALSSFLVLVIFLQFIWSNRKDWRTSIAVQAALAITVVVFGHSLRAFNSWAEFLLLQHGFNPAAWLPYTWVVFLSATVLIVTGKSLMLYIFTPKYRWWLIGVGIPLCLIIPLAVAML
jgi:hypothetical protein